MGLAEMLGKLRHELDVDLGERLFHFASTDRGVTEREPMQPGDLYRASSLQYLCPREEVLANRYDVIRAWHRSASLQYQRPNHHSLACASSYSAAASSRCVQHPRHASP
jgi:hypothetical protein